MVDLYKLTGFEWDKWNLDKSYKKHGITPSEAEEVFLDEAVKIEEDIKHKQREQRFIAIGKTTDDKMFLLFSLSEMIR